MRVVFHNRTADLTTVTATFETTLNAAQSRKSNSPVPDSYKSVASFKDSDLDSFTESIGHTVSDSIDTSDIQSLSRSHSRSFVSSFN
jgi:hypothetical protein